MRRAEGHLRIQGRCGKSAEKTLMVRWGEGCVLGQEAGRWGEEDVFGGFQESAEDGGEGPDPGRRMSPRKKAAGVPGFEGQSSGSWRLGSPHLKQARNLAPRCNSEQAPAAAAPEFVGLAKRWLQFGLGRSMRSWGITAGFLWEPKLSEMLQGAGIFKAGLCPGRPEHVSCGGNLSGWEGTEPPWELFVLECGE